MYDWLLKYGKNQKCEMRSGSNFATPKLAQKKGEEFIVAANKHFIHYPNPKIEVVDLDLLESEKIEKELETILSEYPTDDLTVATNACFLLEECLEEIENLSGGETTLSKKIKMFLEK